MANPAQRRRVPPRQRFAGREQFIDLDGAFAELPRESELRQGHMQKAIYRLGPTTTAIYAFEAGGGLQEHTLEGEAILHVLKGQLRVTTPDQEHVLSSNQVLLLNPGVAHDLQAEEPTRMLLTFVLHDADQGQGT